MARRCSQLAGAGTPAAARAPFVSAAARKSPHKSKEARGSLAAVCRKPPLLCPAINIRRNHTFPIIFLYSAVVLLVPAILSDKVFYLSLFLFFLFRPTIFVFSTFVYFLFLVAYCGPPSSPH